MIAQTNNERNTVLVGALLERTSKLKQYATNDNLFLQAVPGDRRMYLTVDNYNKPIRASVPMIGDAAFQTSVSLNTLTDMLALESKLSDISALHVWHEDAYRAAYVGVPMVDKQLREGAKPLDFWGDEVKVWNPAPELTAPQSNIKPIIFLDHQSAINLAGKGWTTRLYRKSEAQPIALTADTLRKVVTFTAADMQDAFSVASKATAKKDNRPVLQYMQMVMHPMTRMQGNREIRITLTGADGFHCVTREFTAQIGSEWAEQEANWPFIINVSPADFAPVMKGTAKELAKREVAISTDTNAYYLECDDIVVPMDTCPTYNYPNHGDLFVGSDEYKISLTAEQTDALADAIRKAKRGAKKERTYRLIGHGDLQDAEVLAIGDLREDDRRIALPFRLPAYLYLGFDADMMLRCLTGLRNCTWRLKPMRMNRVEYGYFVDMKDDAVMGDWSLLMSLSMSSEYDTFPHPLKDNKPAPQPAQPDRALIVVGQDEPGIASPRLIRRPHALARIHTTLPTGATICLPGPKPDPEPEPVAVVEPEPDPEPEDLTPELLPLNDRLSFANNQIVNLDADTRRDLGDILSDLIDFAVSFLQGDGYNHVALGTKAVDTSVQIRRVGRARCGHDRRDYGPTPETSPNSDRLATLRDKLAGASYGPEWNKTGKQEVADKLRKMVKHLLGIDLPEDLPVYNSRVTYDGWLYRVTPTHTGAMTLQIERLMPVGWRGNKKPMWWPISRYFGWNDGQWCRQSVANIERVYQEELAKQKGKERAS